MAITTQKCSDRRTALNRVAAMVQELITINESADRTRKNLIAAGEDPENTVNAILAAGGPTTISTADATDTLVGDLINMITAQTNNEIGWEYLEE